MPKIHLKVREKIALTYEAGTDTGNNQQGFSGRLIRMILSWPGWTVSWLN